MSTAITHRARLAILSIDLEGRGTECAGVLLEDPESGRLHIRLRRDWDQIAPDQSDVLSLLEDQLAAEASEAGAGQVLSRLEDTLSHTVTINDRREVTVEDFDRALTRLYRENVRANVREFVTHLPRYSLAVAAGPFLENREVEAAGWEEAPPGLRLDGRMFVARIEGRSMEPLIPDGSLCVFRREVTGSRQGKLVLVEALGANDRYTVKRYRSEKEAGADGTWTQQRIRLEPLNAEFEAWDLNPEEDRYRILAEFVQVLD